MCSVSMAVFYPLYVCYSVHVLSLHDCVLSIIRVLQCTCAQSPWLCFIHYTCATVYMCSVSMMAVFYPLYVCYSVHVLSLHDCVLFIIRVLQCTCAQSPWLCFIHYTCATVYMCSVSMAVFYPLYVCYSVHVLSLHAVFYPLYVCSTVYMCSVSMTVFYPLYVCYSVHVLSLHDCVLSIIRVLQCTCAQSPWLCFIHYTCATVYMYSVSMLCFIHYTCATVYMCSVSMTVFYPLYVCYSMYVCYRVLGLSLHGAVVLSIRATVYNVLSLPWLWFLIHYNLLTVVMCSSPWLCFIHYTCATVYMCSVSMAVFYPLYVCYSVHVLSLHDCVLSIIGVLQVYMCSISMAVFYPLYVCYSVHVLSLHDCVLSIIHVLQCTRAQSPWLCFIHHTCATVYMCSVSMAMFYPLYVCYSVHVLSLHDCVFHYMCATVYMCSVSMTVFYPLYMCYSVHVLSLHGCVLSIIRVLQCTCAQSP